MTLIWSLLLVWIFCSLSNNGVQGFSQLTQEEDVELEKQLKLLNKPAVKTIQTEYGDVYDCVDFYKQPAFDHPLLKNHTFHFQMRPSSVPKMMRRKKEHCTSNNTNTSMVELKGLGCPFGTVPIRRVTKDDLIRAKTHKDRYSSRNDSKFSVLTFDNPGTHYAVVRTKFDQITKYNGGGSGIGIYGPDVESSQYSSGRMRIQNAPDSIQVGWTVNPTLYGDSRVRLYTYLKTSQSQCFNTQCPGFVIVSSEIPLDAVLQVSHSGALPSFCVKVFIYRDQAGNWWLEVSDRYTQVGFWPRHIFTGLADLAFDIDWGGEVSSPQSIPSPPMGSGNLLKEDTQYDAFCMNMTTINEDHEVADAENLEEYRDVDAYQVSYVGNIKDPFRHLMVFGGGGGISGS